MATKKKTTKRKSKVGSAAAKKTMKISGSTFQLTQCGTLAAVRASAVSKRNQGLKARVVKKKSGGACLYVGGKSKAKRA
jgi:hypothetical protein